MREEEKKCTFTQVLCDFRWFNLNVALKYPVEHTLTTFYLYKALNSEKEEKQQQQHKKYTCRAYVFIHTG